VPALTLGNLGFGMMKIDTIEYYEIATGYRLPGAFSVGYAHQFGEASYHIFGLIARSSPRFSLGYRTTLGERYHMIGGASLRPFEQYLTISGDIEYEGIDSILDYSYGAMLQPIDGIKLSVLAHHVDDKVRWNAGLELSFGKIKLAGAYSHADEKKLRIGIILSAQPYSTFTGRRSSITQSHLNK
jgi:hypothetical protein